MVITWRDDLKKKKLSLIFIIILFFFFLILFFKNNTIESRYSFINFFFLVLLLPLIFLIPILRIRLSYLTNKGLRIGNAPDDNFFSYYLKHPPIFLPWEHIKHIKIKNKVIRHGPSCLKKEFLIIKDTEGKEYECYLSDSKGLVDALKKVSKENLLKKK